MAWRKVSCLRWILVVLLVIVFPLVFSRPQEPSSLTTLSPSENVNEKPTETPNSPPAKEDEGPALTTPATGSSRNVKKKTPVIGESIKMVASQLLENLNSTAEAPIVADTRIPPKLKNQLPYKNKNKVKVRLDDNETKPENSHAGVAVPVTLEELETENTIINITNESSTTNEGISTWILLSNPTHKDTVSTSTEPTKAEDTQKKQKPTNSKNKTKRPTTSPNKGSTSHPIIASIKSDLVAGGSAINDNVLNKIKDTVLSNVQKNKNTVKTKTTTTTEASTTTVAVEALTPKKEIVTKTPSSEVPAIKVTLKPTKKKNKNKQKLTSTTAEPSTNNESALMPMEPKEQEIELEVSTPATTTKKPKRTSTKRKKNKTKKRKTSTKTDSDTALEVKTTNKTKSAKPAKKPESPITTQIYNYLSREVMPSVGVGVIGLAGLVGLASYFFYPFATPVRRTFEVDKKDDIYRHNAEEYANEGNGQAEEEMLGTVLAGMPAHSKNRLNPYIAQTTHSSPMYSAKKEQDIRYRHVAANYDSSNYNMHYPQQKTGIAHAAVYTDHNNYNKQNQDSRHNNMYTTESKYAYDKTAYTPYPEAEPVFAVSQTDTSGFGNEAASSVVYGVKPSAESDFKPVYPFEGQVLSETTNSPATYPPTSMYLGSNSDAEGTDDLKYMEDKSSSGGIDNKFVVGNVPKDFVDSDTPVVVPEHGPRSLNRRKRGVISKKRSVAIEQVLKDAKLDQKDVYMSNEIDEALSTHGTMEPHSNIMDTIKPAEIKTEIPQVTNDKLAMFENQFVESVSTVPLDINKDTKSTTEEPDESNKIATTTQSFRVYEVFSSTIDPELAAVKLSNQEDEKSNELVGTTTEASRANTETTTDSNRADVTSTLPPPAVDLETKAPLAQPISSTQKPRPPYNPNVITYPPLTEEGCRPRIEYFNNT